MVLHAGTNDIRNLSSEEILDQFDKVIDVVTRDSPETKLILSSLIHNDPPAVRKRLIVGVMAN